MNEPPACAVIETCPGVPPVVFRLKRMTLDAVHAEVVTVTAPGVPDMLPDTPTLSLAAVVAWILSLFPAADRFRLPFVAVISPRVAVRVVPAVTDPAVAAMLPVVDVMPVPAVIVVVAARVVVVVNDPGAVIADGKVHVSVLPEPVTVI